MMRRVRAKKFLGQHFLEDLGIARRITESLSTPPSHVVEVGPGMGVLTQFLVQREDLDLYLVEIDSESVEYLHQHYPQLSNRIIEGDFLKFDFNKIFPDKFSIIGNFPYNISSQIFFKVFDNRNHVDKVVGMVQREVGRRIASGPGSKEYGILSVLLQSFYTIEYLMTVDEHVFSPPPKVKSGVIRLVRNEVDKLPCNERLFVKVVKAAFQHRRKTMRNSLKYVEFDHGAVMHLPVFDLRPEQMSVEAFQELTKLIEEHPLCE